MPDNFYAAGLHRKPAQVGHLQHTTGETSPELPVQEGDSRRSKRGESRRTGEAPLIRDMSDECMHTFRI